MENLKELTGTRTRNRPAQSAMPQSAVLPQSQNKDASTITLLDSFWQNSVQSGCEFQKSRHSESLTLYSFLNEFLCPLCLYFLI